MADLSTLDDRVLWNRATQARCEDAFRTLMTRHEDLVWSACTRLLRHTSDAEDAFQMTFIAVLEHGDDIKSSDFRPWLYRVAYRAALRVQSGRLDVDALTDADSVPEDSVDTDVFRSIERAEQSQLIDEALDSLPEKYREVLVLHYCCGVARDDIASQLGLTVQTVKSRLSRARKALRSRLLRRGLSLSTAAALLGANAKAAVPPDLHEATWQLAQRWLIGEPVGLDLAQFSDFPQTEYGMKSLSGLNAKWTLVGAATLLALFFVYEAGRASGTPTSAVGTADGANRLPANATPIAFEEQESNDMVPAAHFVAKPAAPEPVAQHVSPVNPVQRPAANTQPIQPYAQSTQPYAQSYRPQMPNTRMVSATTAQQPSRGLPNGTWKRDSMFGEISFLVDGNRLQVDFLGQGELAMMRGSLLGEYSVASDGTIFGLFHGADLDLPDAGIEAAAELAPLLGLVSDSPFAMRVHTAGNAMVIKSFTLGMGMPLLEGIGDYAQVGMTASMYVSGTYRSAQLPQRVGQRPPAVAPWSNYQQPTASYGSQQQQPYSVRPAVPRATTYGPPVQQQPGIQPNTQPTSGPATLPGQPRIAPATTPPTAKPST